MPGPALHATSSTAYAALAALVAWRVYVRFKRAVGRQRLTRYRAPVTLSIYAILVGTIVVAARAHPVMLVELAAFIAGGALLARHALSKTTFEATPGGLYYTPHQPLALALAVLFAARIGYRVVQVMLHHPDTVQSTGDFARSPVTLAAFGLLIGYNATYVIGLAAWRRRVLKARDARIAAADAAEPAAPPPTESSGDER